MIDFGKVQADAVKSIYKSRITGKAEDYKIYRTIMVAGKEYIPIIHKGVSMYLIPERHYLLIFELAEVGNPIEKIFKSVETAEQLTDTKTIKLLAGRQLKEFRTKADKSIYVDEKLLKPFGQGLKYYAGENSDIVYIKEAEEWIGLVFATRIVKESE